MKIIEKIKIYLSPSKQSSNIYAIGNTNEKAEMEALAGRIKSMLENGYECECHIASPELGIDISGRPKEANDFGCKIYLALHSNAGGGGKASGAVAYYHPEQKDGRNLAANIVGELNLICPVKSNRVDPVANGMVLYDGQGLGEIRNPARYGITAVLAETDFHDNIKIAEWLVTGREAIAAAYVKALAESFGIPRKVECEDPGTSQALQAGADLKLYRVQVGVFS